MICSRLWSNGITQVDQLNPAESTMLVEVDDNIVGFNVCRRPALVKTWMAEKSERGSIS